MLRDHGREHEEADDAEAHLVRVKDEGGGEGGGVKVEW